MFKHLFEFNEPYAYIDGSTGGVRGAAVSYTHLTLPTIYSV